MRHFVTWINVIYTMIHYVIQNYWYAYTLIRVSNCYVVCSNGLLDVRYRQVVSWNRPQRHRTRAGRRQHWRVDARPMPHWLWLGNYRTKRASQIQQIPRQLREVSRSKAAAHSFASVNATSVLYVENWSNGKMDQYNFIQCHIRTKCFYWLSSK